MNRLISLLILLGAFTYAEGVKVTKNNYNSNKVDVFIDGEFFGTSKPGIPTFDYKSGIKLYTRYGNYIGFFTSDGKVFSTSDALASEKKDGVEICGGELVGICKKIESNLCKINSADLKYSQHSFFDCNDKWRIRWQRKWEK